MESVVVALDVGGTSIKAALIDRPGVVGRLTFRPAPPISLSVPGDRAGVLGAALRAWDHLDVVR